VNAKQFLQDIQSEDSATLQRNIDSRKYSFQTRPIVLAELRRRDKALDIVSDLHRSQAAKNATRQTGNTLALRLGAGLALAVAIAVGASIALR
jgi:hypothetical protein